jgi:hypothetical protein
VVVSGIVLRKREPVYFRPTAKAESYYVGTRNPPATLMRQLESNEAGTKMTLAPFLSEIGCFFVA